MPKPIATIDFETHAIKGALPPKPVGVAVKIEGQSPIYLHWGHPDEGNTTEEQARTLVGHLFQTHEILCHNAAFDLAVAKYHWGLEFPATLHDTMFQLFLENPHSENLSLKPNAERILGLPPEEQDVLHEWIVANVKKATPKTAGAYICEAPSYLVTPYAIGDVERTYQMYMKLRDIVPTEPYKRECQLLPILVNSTLQGVCLNLEQLQEDVAYYKHFVLPEEVDTRIFEYLKAEAFNIDSGEELADAIDRSHVAVDWIRTEKGTRSTSKDNLPKAIKDSYLLNLLRYRGILSTCLDTFMLPWSENAANGRIHFHWNQVRNREAKDSAGARTGRLSSSPSLLNVPRKHGKNKALWEGLQLPPLPNVRSYLVPDSGQLWLKRDYCFSSDTEVLTESGWKLFSELSDDDLVAQVDTETNVLTYAEPLARQAYHYSGLMVHIRGERQIDMLMTTGHRCFTKSIDTQKVHWCLSEDYPVGGREAQIQAANFEGAGDVDLNLLRLLAAYQADASYKPRQDTVVWKLKKERKIERLRSSLVASGVLFEEKVYASAPGFTWFIVRKQQLAFLQSYISMTSKTFKRRLAAISVYSRRFFLEELSFWDGYKQQDSCWVYLSTNLDNCELVQELATISGFRANVDYNLPSQVDSRRQIIGTVRISRKPHTYVETLAKEIVYYDSMVYCCTMPLGTLVVRRNGRAAVTGNCSQEIRVLAHYEDGALMEAFKAEPRLDMHQFMMDKIKDTTSMDVSRDDTKTVAFAILYGAGLEKLAQQLRCSYDDAQKVKNAYLTAVPGIRNVQRAIKGKWDNGLPFKTFGGRFYNKEASRMVKGRMVDFGYKGLNYLIQGSSADITKQAIINYSQAAKDGRFLIAVHDELNISGPESEMAVLRDAMLDIPLDVALLSDGSVGKSYGSLEEFTDVPWE